MKKLLIAASIMALLVTPAQAGKKTNYLLGGILGGVVLGGILYDHNRRTYVEEQRVYVRPAHQECRTQWYQEWNPHYRMYENVPRTVCYWVQ